MNYDRTARCVSKSLHFPQHFPSHGNGKISNFNAPNKKPRSTFKHAHIHSYTKNTVIRRVSHEIGHMHNIQYVYIHYAVSYYVIQCTRGLNGTSARHFRCGSARSKRDKRRPFRQSDGFGNTRGLKESSSSPVLSNIQI